MLECSDIQLKLGGAAILRGISLAVRPGEFVAMIGPNGAGKSSLLHILSGALQPDDGEVTLDGCRLAHWRPEALARRRAVLPQTPTLSFPFSALDVVLLGRSPHAGRTTRQEDLHVAEAALRETDTFHLIERIYPTLSGGERQRVHLARILAQIWPTKETEDQASRYVLLDEPTNNLDIAHQHAMMATASRLARSGCGVLAILHDPNIAAIYADRICVLDAGQIVADGPPDTVITPSLLEETFGLRVTVMRHPDHGRPVMLPALPVTLNKGDNACSLP